MDVKSTQSESFIVEVNGLPLPDKLPCVVTVVTDEVVTNKRDAYSDVEEE